MAGVDQKTLRKRLNYGIFCKDKMIKSNIRLVISIAKNYQGSGMNLQDLVQVYSHLYCFLLKKIMIVENMATLTVPVINYFTVSHWFTGRMQRPCKRCREV